MSYENSLQCKLLSTPCIVCGKPLVDSISIEMGMGPDCRNDYTGGISPETQKACNVLTHDAAVAARDGNIVKVRKISEMIRDLGLAVLADKILERFKNAERLAKIRITETSEGLLIKTPFKRTGDFITAWRLIPGRRYRMGKNLVPETSKREVWELLKRFFPGEYGVGPQGAFRVPKNPKNEAA